MLKHLDGVDEVEVVGGTVLNALSTQGVVFEALSEDEVLCDFLILDLLFSLIFQLL